MKTFLCLIVFLAASGVSRAEDNVVSSPLEFHQQKFDVLSYEVKLDLTKAPRTDMRGVCITSFRWLDSLNVKYFFHLRGLTIDSAFLDGRRVYPEFVEDSLHITEHFELTPSFKPKYGDTSRLVIYYGGSMTAEPGSSAWGGVLSNSGTLYAMGVGFTAPYVSATRHWLPCYDHPSDKAAFHATILMPKGYFAASNGVLLRYIDADTAECEWEQATPCATYLLTFAVDKYVPVYISASSPAVVYSKPADSAATRISFSRLPEMIACFEKYFIPYPFEKVGYVNTPTGAMEHQTMISFNTSLSLSKNTVNSVAAHELAHQWFGDLTTPVDFRHVWLTESFATFCETLWAECAGVQGGYLQEQSNKLSRYLNMTSKAEGVMPLYDFPRKAPSSNYPETIYQKGAVVLGMLRYELGDSAFFGGIKAYLQRYKYSTASTNDLRSVLEKESGKDLSRFFHQWIESPGWPIITIDTSSVAIGGGLRNLQVRISQIQSSQYGVFVNVPVEIGFKNKNSGEFTYHILNLTDTQQYFTLDSLPEYSTVTINEGPSLRALIQVARISDAAEENSFAKHARIKVMPNPFSGSITIVFFTTSPEAVISVINPVGKTVYMRKYETERGENTISAPLSDLVNGTYFVRVETGGEKYSAPVILQR